MINWFLVIVAVLVALLTVGISIYVVLIFTTPSELRVAILPKIVAVLGLSLACFIVLLLPYDAANKKNPTAVKDYSTGVDTVLMWEIVFWATAVWILVLIPFSMFFYEAHDPEQFSFVQQCVPAFLYTLGTLVAFVVVFLALYFSIGVAQIPYWSYAGIPSYLNPFDTAVPYSISKSAQTLEINVSVYVYMVGLLVGVGWVLFLLYGGVGLVAVPVGLSRSLYKIPKRPLSEAEFIAEKEKIAMNALTMLKKAQHMQKTSSTTMRSQREINQFQAEVNKLERSFSKASNAFEDGSLHYVRLVLILFACLVCTTLSVLWLVHIFIYNTTNYALFLNAALRDLDKAFSLFGVLFYGIFAFYLLWCAIAGCVKVGLRFTFFSIHPMKYRDTRVNSILFNIGLMLITSVAVVQFCAYSFVPYVSNTAADALFDTYVRRLKGIGQLFIYFQWAFVGVAALSIFWVIICPRPKPKPDKDEDD